MMGDIAICSVCKKLMKAPRILPCFHSFCLKCLNSAISSSTSKGISNCPTCQIAFQIPHGGLKDLKINDFIVNLMSMKRDCNSCKKNIAIKFCVECSVNYCSTCLQVHDKIPATGKHNLQPVRSTKDNESSTCGDHYEEITYFCEDCKVVLCDNCPINLQHKSHNIKRITEYINAVRQGLAKNLEIAEENVRNVVSNCKRSEATKYDNEMKASNLKKQIQQRGEDVKKAVDSIVNELIKKIDQELKPYQKEADDVLLELKNMETNLNAKIETLKQQLNDLNYQNIAKMPQHDVISCQQIDYIKQFDVPPMCGASDVIHFLEKAIESFRGPKLNVVREDDVSNNAKSFDCNENELYVCYYNSTKVDSFSLESWQPRKRSRNFNKFFVEIEDLFINKTKLYVSGKRPDFLGGYRFGIILTNVWLSMNPTQIYLSPYDCSELKMSKSFGDEVFIHLNNILVHLEDNGNMDLAKLSFVIREMIQFDFDLYVVVTCNGDVSIINGRGQKLKRYVDKDGNQINVDCVSLAKDKHGYIYVGEPYTITTLNRELQKMSTSHIQEGVRKIYYHESKDALMVLSHSGTLLTFKSEMSFT